MRKRNETRFDTITVQLKAIWLWLSAFMFLLLSSIVRFRVLVNVMCGCHAFNNSARARSRGSILVLLGCVRENTVLSALQREDQHSGFYFHLCSRLKVWSRFLFYFPFLNYSLFGFASTFRIIISTRIENSLISSFFWFYAKKEP